MVNWAYYESYEQRTPEGDGWEYWGARQTPDETVHVYRRDSKTYGDDGQYINGDTVEYRKMTGR